MFDTKFKITTGKKNTSRNCRSMVVVMVVGQRNILSLKQKYTGLKDVYFQFMFSLLLFPYDYTLTFRFPLFKSILSLPLSIF